MSYEFYKILHFVGIFMVLMSLSNLAVGAWTTGGKNFAHRKMFAAIHGIGLLISLVAGFGLLARLGLVSGFPGWAYGKLLVWLFLGGIPVLLYRKPQMGKIWWWSIWAAAVVGAYLARFKVGSL